MRSCFLPYVQGGFTLEKFSEVKKRLEKVKKSDSDACVTNEWKKDRSGNVVVAKTVASVAEGESSAELIFENVWLFEEEIPDRFFADPRTSGTPSLKDLPFK